MMTNHLLMTCVIKYFLSGKIRAMQKVLARVPREAIDSNDVFRFIEWCVTGYSEIFFTNADSVLGEVAITSASLEQMKYMVQKSKDVYEMALTDGTEETRVFTKAVYDLAQAIREDMVLCEKLA